MWQLIIDKNEIKDYIALVESRFNKVAEKINGVIFGYQGGNNEGDAYWIDQLGIYAQFEERSDDKKYWNPFGVQRPISGKMLSITVEINMPIEGSNRRLGGAFVKNEEDKIALVHNGQIGGGKKGVGKQLFFDNYPGEKIVVTNEGEYVIVGV